MTAKVITNVETTHVWKYKSVTFRLTRDDKKGVQATILTDEITEVSNWFTDTKSLTEDINDIIKWWESEEAPESIDMRFLYDYLMENHFVPF